MLSEREVETKIMRFRNKIIGLNCTYFSLSLCLNIYKNFKKRKKFITSEDKHDDDCWNCLNC